MPSKCDIFDCQVHKYGMDGEVHCSIEEPIRKGELFTAIFIFTFGWGQSLELTKVLTPEGIAIREVLTPGEYHEYLFRVFTNHEPSRMVRNYLLNDEEEANKVFMFVAPTYCPDAERKNLLAQGEH